MSVQTSEEGLIIYFPKAMDPEKIEGTVSLYRPSNKQLDFQIPIPKSNKQLLIPKSRLLDGRWDIRVAWNYEEKPFLYRTRVTF